MQIKMYTKDTCSFCYAAKNLLLKRGISWEEIPINGDAAAAQEMQTLTGRATVPQILLDGKPIGGYMELVNLDMEGGLQSAGGEGQA